MGLKNISQHSSEYGPEATFLGGVCLPDHKAESEDLSITDFMDPPSEMVFPMSQHIGAPCKPVVKKGDHVLRDQIIGEPAGLGVNIFTSVSGTVKEVKKVLHPNGTYGMGVVIENDHQYETLPQVYQPASYKELTKDEIRERIRYAGIVGMGGAGFPTCVKMTPKDDSSIDYILLNGSECEPYLTSDYRVMLEDPWRVVNGLRIILQLFPNAKGKICIENNKMKAVKVISDYVKDDPRIEIVVLKSKFPEGGEKMLIEAVTGREVPSGKLPADVGCIVMNIDTSVAVSRAVTQGRPLQRRIVTVAGDCVETPRNYRVRIGTSIADLIDHIGPLKAQPRKILCGGPMMGMALDTLNVPIVKTTSCILLLSEKAAPPVKESPCIRCGKCIEACPMHLQPYLLNQLVTRRDIQGFIAMHGPDCIECGSCSYVCPARRYLTQSFRAGKALANDLRKAQKAKKEQEKNGKQ